MKTINIKAAGREILAPEPATDEQVRNDDIHTAHTRDCNLIVNAIRLLAPTLALVSDDRSEQHDLRPIAWQRPNQSGECRAVVERDGRELILAAMLDSLGNAVLWRPAAEDGSDWRVGSRVAVSVAEFDALSQEREMEVAW